MLVILRGYQGILPTATLISSDRESIGEFIFNNRSAYGAFEAPTVPLTIGPSHETACLVQVRLRRQNSDRTARRVSTIKPPLRTLEHLNTIDVKQTDTAERVRGHVHLIVENSGDRRVIGVKVFQSGATNNPCGQTRTPRVGEFNVGDKCRQLLHIRKPQLSDLGTVKRRDRDGHVLEALLPLLGGHNNFF